MSKTSNRTTQQEDKAHQETVEPADLISLALDEKPPSELPERVMATVALLGTGIELGRLIFCAPVEAVHVHGDGDLAIEGVFAPTKSEENGGEQ